ncbi:PDZ domain-containing protein [Desulfonema limicola]|uniref:PDZ domain-containing protein n=1 Tax=Desulfonema limicola TaxID=45656 RepID=A0A975B6P6_9BACT|nr:PDZ domain-containing protein [Desulfonema limicola]QTA79779.1 PDZ domain-containing protein [Desulfonema limicola]
MKSKFLIFAGLIFLICQQTTLVPANSASVIKVYEDKLSFQVQKEPLGNIINEIIDKFDVEIVGLETREDDLVTFSAEQEPVEDVIKRLLKHLDENNYAFEYSKTALRRVSVMPKAKGPNIAARPPLPAPAPGPVPGKNDRERAVKILNVNEGTQAEALDLQKNDLIIEYDGNRIQSSSQLVEAVKKKTPNESVEMVVLREGQSIRLILNGGLIGVNVVTVSISKSDLEN